ncbi:RNA degradosome polyphosphate kinase [Heliobacterium gestii]|uniref:Polyphosphate kinase n=1 Tax=Heliomicrobium gestii TaxID=2699 RepID=A0A845L9A8_HELGE|nr:RNA degradosome polyphosphate kinase [Heliomicrobium gestii]MBM7867861.1 polyphosphate kinase [Heliomicrobium gestii]MZP43327.1 RNA degradosome polyphosphate kinase [Heliomicrobium gestii]
MCQKSMGAEPNANGASLDSAPERKTFNRSEYYINRELSWLEFNQRVLEEALDRTNPLLERLKFLAIVSSNLDEFFMVRVAGVQDQKEAGLQKRDPSGLTPSAQLKLIAERTHRMVEDQYAHLMNNLLPELKEKGIHFLRCQELNRNQRIFVENHFEHVIYPVLTPLAVDQSRPFPLLANKSLNIAVYLEPENNLATKRQLFAVVQVPSVLPRFIEVPCADGEAFVLLEDLIKSQLEVLFRGNHILHSSTFRITRNADLTVDEEGAEDLLEAIEKELQKRKWGAEVRLEVEAGVSPAIREYLKADLELDDEDIYTVPGPLDLTVFLRIVDLPGYDNLRHEKMTPQEPEDLVGEKNIFAAIAKKDILLHHPYESFDPVVELVAQAARDPRVLAIKQTLYRVSGDSSIVKALAEAARKGKQVTVLVELKARFDEEKNIAWAKTLEKAGCHVIYGLVGLKTHAKIILVVRQEEGTIRRYVHLGTGNYNDATARFYTDFGLLTCAESFGADATDFFNEVTGYAVPAQWREIEAAPLGLRKKFYRLIEREIEASTPEKPGRIIAKMNSLTDERMIQMLYRASCAGVQIDLIVRGICCLRPGIPGVSENVRVTSIVGRFLEHHRAYYFQNGGSEEIYLSSADWMDRNLDRRVELLFPVKAPSLAQRVKATLEMMLKDNIKARRLLPDGTYVRVCREGEEVLQSQVYFLKHSKRRGGRSARRNRTLTTSPVNPENGKESGEENGKKLLH